MEVLLVSEGLGLQNPADEQSQALKLSSFCGSHGAWAGKAPHQSNPCPRGPHQNFKTNNFEVEFWVTSASGVARGSGMYKPSDEQSLAQRLLISSQGRHPVVALLV